MVTVRARRPFFCSESATRSREPLDLGAHLLQVFQVLA